MQNGEENQEEEAADVVVDEVRAADIEEAVVIEAWLKKNLSEKWATVLVQNGAASQDALRTIAVEDLTEIGVPKFQARGVVSKIQSIWGQGYRDPMTPLGAAREREDSDSTVQFLAARLSRCERGG